MRGELLWPGILIGAAQAGTTYAVIYGIIGVLALKLALGAGGKATNQQGALKTIAAAGAKPSARDRREFALMGQEKIEAGVESASAMAAQMMTMNPLLGARAVKHMMRGAAAVLATLSVVTIAGKFLIRVRGKHVFNPTNFALVAMMLATGEVWVSPGQWGSGLVLAFQGQFADALFEGNE